MLLSVGMVTVRIGKRLMRIPVRKVMSENLTLSG